MANSNDATVASPKIGSKKMYEWLVFVVIVAGWIALQAYILPRFGVST